MSACIITPSPDQQQAVACITTPSSDQLRAVANDKQKNNRTITAQAITFSSSAYRSLFYAFY
jgi:hypothetical protein